MMLHDWVWCNTKVSKSNLKNLLFYGQHFDFSVFVYKWFKFPLFSH